MKHIIEFLEAETPLTKRFRQNEDGSIEKEAFINAYRVTSHQIKIETLSELYKKIVFHADLGHCLLKGNISRTLTNESRKGTTKTDATTTWVCLDFDRHECDDIDAELTRLGIGDVSYIVQYSSSHGMPDTEGTVSCHVFMLMDGALPAPTLKAWLMGLNMNHLKDELRLSRDKNQISWPLDITTCQNDKLLYISPPVFVKPLKDPLKTRIALVPKAKATLSVKRIGEGNINALKVEERKLLNELRKGEGLEPRRAKTTFVGEKEIHNKPDTCAVTGIKDCGEYVRLNLNGGDSWAYWHDKKDFTLIHDFKTDAWYKTKELVPGYYADLCGEQAELNATPNEEGDLILAFRDKLTADYYNGIWNPEQKFLELNRAKNETQLEHWMLSHGRTMGEFIPIWEIVYKPLEDWIVDADNHRVNLYEMSPYLRLDPVVDAQFPVIKSILMHMLGVKKENDPIYKHFINWLAVVIQRTGNPHVQTSWVLHGNEGTGKGTFFHKIMAPILGRGNISYVNVDNIEEQFNGWIENKLFVYVDEVDVNDFKEKGRVAGKLRSYITEPTISVRRMRQAPLSIENYAAFVFASNQKRPVQIPPSDRRYNVANFQKTRLEYPGDAAIEAELESFTQYMLAFNANVELANTVIDTEERRNIQALSVTSVDATCSYIVDGDFDALWFSRPDDEILQSLGMNSRTAVAQTYATLLDNMAKEIMVDKNRKVTRDELWVLLQYNVGNMPESPNKFTALLRHHGIATKKVWWNGRTQQGMDVKWTISNELATELAEKFKAPKLRRAK